MSGTRWTHLFGHALGGAFVLFVLSAGLMLALSAVVRVPSTVGGTVILLASAAGAVVAARGKWAIDLRRQRRTRGLCVRCGYDLRGGHARCPECGGTA